VDRRRISLVSQTPRQLLTLGPETFEEFSAFAKTRHGRNTRSCTLRIGVSSMARSRFYAVARGRQPGIFESWAEAEEQVKGYSDCRHKSFSTYEEAKEWLRELGMEM